MLRGPATFSVFGCLVQWTVQLDNWLSFFLLTRTLDPGVKAGADLPKAVLNLAKPDSRKQKRKIQKSKIEREELQTKLPKRDLKATETVSHMIFSLMTSIFFQKRRRQLMSDKKRKEMAKKRKILNEQNGENDDDGWEIADGN